MQDRLQSSLFIAIAKIEQIWNVYSEHVTGEHLY